MLKIRKELNERLSKIRIDEESVAKNQVLFQVNIYLKFLEIGQKLNIESFLVAMGILVILGLLIILGVLLKYIWVMLGKETSVKTEFTVFSALSIVQ